MYQNRYIQYLNLPQIPKEIADAVPLDPTAFSIDAVGPSNLNNYVWSKSHNVEVNEWCQKHICSELFYAFQFMTADSKIHKDTGTLTKMNYVISTGGNDVWTDFFADDKTTLLASYKIQPNRWHIFKADTFHQVRNVQPGQIRLAVTTRIFGVEA